MPSDKSDTATYPFAFFSGDEANGYTYYKAGTFHSLKTADSQIGYANYVGKTACLRADGYDIPTQINPTYIKGKFTIPHVVP